MASLNISIPDALKTFVEGKVAQGGYGDLDAYVHALIEAERQRDELSVSYQAELVAGQADLDAGRLVEYDDQSLGSLGENIKRAGRERLAPSDRHSPPR